MRLNRYKYGATALVITPTAHFRTSVSASHRLLYYLQRLQPPPTTSLWPPRLPRSSPATAPTTSTVRTQLRTACAHPPRCHRPRAHCRRRRTCIKSNEGDIRLGTHLPPGLADLFTGLPDHHPVRRRRSRRWLRTRTASRHSLANSPSRPPRTQLDPRRPHPLPRRPRSYRRSALGWVGFGVVLILLTLDS
ncbi:hypothetical protein C8R46DRAFT_515844 [Mycena filopes]|nr:hypothetical protein C8R46DRAFT_515844 [Mycena filopes]